MNSKYVSYFAYSIIVLAVIGLLYSLISNPGRLFGNILTIIIIAAIILLLLRVFAGQRYPVGGTNQKQYVKAARLSKRRFKKSNRPQRAMGKHKKAIKRTSSVGASHLTVIEGKKGKKKNRALH